MGREAGITEEKLVDLERYDSSDRFSKEERLVLRLADAMVSTPARIDDGLFSDLKSVLREEQLVEIVSALAWENYRARFNRVFDVESEDFSHGAFCPVPAGPGRESG